jgi:2-polyprenyl-6-hydroxyphenyl methylase / 3-demethylubiquinone-9 3-methyltransferase
MVSRQLARPRNDPRQYDDLADAWWEPGGAFAALRWIAAARAEVVPPPPRPGAVLVDAACGGGLMAPYVGGYRHVGVDVSASAVAVAAAHGVEVVRGDVTALPLADGIADVVVAGEIFEHVGDLDAAVREVARVLKPGGLLVCDTINNTPWARFVLVTVGERIRGVAPPGIHDPALFVAPDRLVAVCARHGVHLRVWGLRPRPLELLGFLADRARPVRLRPTRSLRGLYQGVGRKAAA